MSKSGKEKVIKLKLGPVHCADVDKMKTLDHPSHENSSSGEHQYLYQILCIGRNGRGSGQI